MTVESWNSPCIGEFQSEIILSPHMSWKYLFLWNECKHTGSRHQERTLKINLIWRNCFKDELTEVTQWVVLDLVTVLTLRKLITTQTTFEKFKTWPKTVTFILFFPLILNTFENFLEAANYLQKKCTHLCIHIIVILSQCIYSHYWFKTKRGA